MEATLTKNEEVVETLRERLIETETISADDAKALERMTTLTLGDLIREGSTVTTQEYGWGAGSTACALSAAAIALKARGYAK